MKIVANLWAEENPGNHGPSVPINAPLSVTILRDVYVVLCIEK